MVVGVDKSQGPVVRLDWGDVKTKSDVTTDILCQWHAIPLQSSHYDEFVTYQASVATW